MAETQLPGDQILDNDVTDADLATDYPKQWRASVSWLVGNLVFYQRDVYVCIVANSDATFTASKWYKVNTIPYSGLIYWNANATATVISNTTSYFKIAGTTTAKPLVGFDTNSQNNRLRYIGPEAANFDVKAVVNVGTFLGNNQTLAIGISINGVQPSAPFSQYKNTATGDLSQIVLEDIITLNPNDYIEVWIRNFSAANNIVTAYGQLKVKRI